MKKLFSVLLVIAMLAAIMVGCAKNDTPAADTDAGDGSAEKTLIRLGGLTGPTTIGMVKLLDDGEKGLTENDYAFTIGGSADELTPKLLKGELDIIAAPVNLGSILYNNSNGAVCFLGINTLGVVYIVESGGETVTDWESLRGKTILATGKGSTPQYALEYLLGQNGVDPANDVTIEWKSEPAEIVAQMSTGENVVAMMPQPYVTVAQGKVEGMRVVIDMTAEWDALENGSKLVTAGLIARTEFVKENPEAVAKFLVEYAASTEFVNENVAEAAVLVEKYNIVKAAVAEKAIPKCNIVCITGEEMVPVIKGYFDILFSQNPKALGGALPGEEFYYAG